MINTCFETTNTVRELATYAHVLPAAMLLVIGLFILIKERNILTISFFLFIFYFATWFISDWFLWVSNDYHLINALWSIVDYIDVVAFLAAVYFFSIYVNKKDLNNLTKIIFVILTLVPLYLTLSGQSISSFYEPNCNASESPISTYYHFGIEVISIISIFILSLKRRNERKTTHYIVSVSLLMFLAIFSVTGFISSQITSIDSPYLYQLYGMFVLPIFIILMMLAITRYDIFNLHILNQQLIVWTIVPLVASQFFFISGKTNLILNLITFVLALAFVYLLSQNIKRENKYLKMIEGLNSNLSESSKNKENLIHFISHEIKGFLTKNQAAFSEMLEGDFGEISPEVKTLAQTALEDTRKGVVTVMDILNASNLKKGTVKFNVADFDIGEAIKSVVSELQGGANAKGLSINLSIPNIPIIVKGDKTEIANHVVKNLIDNAIKYTPKGSIDVSLSKDESKIVFSVKDSGIGIIEEDKRNLFTEGGRGKDAIRTNVNSTGYGLFIAKQIIDAHKGKIWAESEGQGKGSKFTFELPA